MYVNRIHQRSLRFVHGDNKSSFEELLQKYESEKIHYKNLQVLATEIYKVKQGLLPQIMHNIFELKNVPYNIKRKDLFPSRNVHSVRLGTDNLTYLGQKIWDIVPLVIKNSESLSVFKTKIKH